MSEILFFFGAGASFGAGYSLPEVPPLGSELFKQLKTTCPGSWGRLPPDLDAKFRSNFELGMLELYEKYSPSIAALMRDMALYFIQFRPSSDSNLYCKLIAFLKSNNLVQKTVLSSLNYECVLEYAILSKGLGLQYFQPATKPNELLLLKLHGSCNMFSASFRASGISFGAGVSFGGGVEAPLDQNEVITRILSDSSLYPSMCLYMKGKPIQIASDTVRMVQDMWVKAVQNARKIFIIGVFPNSEDVHIWDTLKNSDSEIYYIGSKDAFDVWIAGRSIKKNTFLHSYFDRGLEGIQKELKIP